MDAEQPLSARTRETYLAAVRTFVAWLGERDGGVGEALSSPRGRDLAARDYKRRMKVERRLAPASVNQALAGLDHLFRIPRAGRGDRSPAGAAARRQLPLTETPHFCSAARQTPTWPGKPLPLADRAALRGL